MQKVLGSLILVLILSGCGKQLDQYVGGVTRPDTPTLPTSGDLDLEGKLGVKVSGGHVLSTSNSFSMKAGVTQSQNALKGNTVSAKVGISRAPASNQ